MSAKERLKASMGKESVTLLPCFYFVEVRQIQGGGGHITPCTDRLDLLHCPAKN